MLPLPAGLESILHLLLFDQLLCNYSIVITAFIFLCSLVCVPPLPALGCDDPHYFQMFL